MVGIFFIISYVIFNALLVLFPLKNNKTSFLLRLVFSIVFSIIFNAIIVVFTNFIGLPSLLISRFIILLIVDIILLVVIIKKKRIQSYFFDYKDIIVSFLILIFCIFIGWFRFDKYNKIYFETTDMATHYHMAERFADTSRISEKRKKYDKKYLYREDKSSSMYLCYVTMGTFFQISDELNNGSLVKIYSMIVFELGVLFFTGISVYLLLINKCTKKRLIDVAFAVLLIVLCLAGYPLNNFIFGFHYLGFGILVLLLIIRLFYELLDNKENTLIYSILCGILAFNLFTTYYMFVPVAFGACGVYALIKFALYKEINFKVFIKVIGISLVIPFIFGIYYYFIRNHFVLESSESSISVFKLEGYIYRNLLGNILIPVALSIYIFVMNVIRKKIKIEEIAMFFCLGFIMILFVYFYNNDIASYYYYKLYYLIWPILFIIIGNNIFDVEINYKILSKVFIIFSLFMFVYEIKDFSELLASRNQLIDNTPIGSAITNVYWFNELKTDKKNNPYIYTNNEIRDLDDLKYKNKYLQDKPIVFYGGLLQKLWFFNITGFNPNNNSYVLNSFYDNSPEIKDLKSDGVEYVIAYKYRLDDFNSKKFKLIFENRSFIIIQVL